MYSVFQNKDKRKYQTSNVVVVTSKFLQKNRVSVHKMYHSEIPNQIKPLQEKNGCVILWGNLKELESISSGQPCSVRLLCITARIKGVYLSLREVCPFPSQCRAFQLVNQSSHQSQHPRKAIMFFPSQLL